MTKKEILCSYREHLTVLSFFLLSSIMLLSPPFSFLLLFLIQEFKLRIDVCGVYMPHTVIRCVSSSVMPTGRYFQIRISLITAANFYFTPVILNVLTNL
jgi:hypothetical protein